MKHFLITYRLKHGTEEQRHQEIDAFIAALDNDPAAIAEAVTAVVSRPEEHRRACARRRAEMFTWQRAAVDMLTTLGAPSLADDCDDSQHTA